MKRWLILCSLLTALSAPGAPLHTAFLDGRPTEYDLSERVGTNAYAGTGSFGPGIFITNLYVTWDAQNLYVMLQGSEVNDKWVVMLDVDPGVGTGATTTTNWANTNITVDLIRFNDVGWRKSDDLLATDFGLDYMIASEGTFNNVLRILYDGSDDPTTNNVESLFDMGNSSFAQGTPVDMASTSDTSVCDLKGLEAKIPWSVLYTTNGNNRFGEVQVGQVVPQGASLRLFANLHNNQPNAAFSASDTIPVTNSPLSSYAGGLLTTDDYLDIPVDQNSDGFPDGAVGDVNAPFLRAVQGLAASRVVYALFNEPVLGAPASNTANWLVNGSPPSSVDQVQDNAVLLNLGSDLPAVGTVADVTATNIMDATGNQRLIRHCLFPGASGLSTSVAVRFVLNTGFGMGPGATGYALGATNFFVNGGALPLEFGFPPATSSPLSQLSGSLYFRDVTFPPGTPLTLNYKYSALLRNTGTNNYEAVRLNDFANISRLLTLNTNGVSMVVTDHLGAAAAPLRDPGGAGYTNLYFDARRGDAGVPVRRTIVFQLDLTAHDTNAFDRVLIQGTDPLRGFNATHVGASDFAAAAGVGWDVGGLTLYDDGTNGDTNANDGIYARLWSGAPAGADSQLVPGVPNSLVGGDGATAPYQGINWATRRSPRSFKYRYYVVRDPAGTPATYDSPESDIEVYLEGEGTNLVLAPFVWADTGLPLKPPSNAADIVSFAASGVTNGTNLILFVNLPGEPAHTVEIAQDLVNGPWFNYDTKAAGAGGMWTAKVKRVGSATQEFYRVLTGPGNPAQRIHWTPNPLPATGALLHVNFNQNQTGVSGVRQVTWFGRIFGGPFTNLVPMTFLGNGAWTVDVPVPPQTNQTVQFLFSDTLPPGHLEKQHASLYGVDIAVEVNGKVTWIPENPASGSPVTIDYNALNGPFPATTNVLLWHGFDSFQGFANPSMTNQGGGLYRTTITIPAQYSNTMDFVFRNTGTGSFDNIAGGLNWHILIEQ